MMKTSDSKGSFTRSSSSLSAAQFDIIAQIGTGSFGTVFRAVHIPSNTQCAIKRIDLESSDDDIEEIQREIAILAECNDHNITRYFGCFMHEFELWIVMEFLGGGSCLDLVKGIRPSTLPESVIAEIMAQVVTGLEYLHSSGKIHRDIKAANVLIADNGDVKIADFGVASQLSNNLSRRNTFVGTPFWMAPEVINQLDYHYSADIWSLGITAYELAYGKPPWSHLHPMKALFSIPRSEPPRLDSKFSDQFQSFVSKCLQMDPTKRPTISQLSSHPFLMKRSRQELIQMLHIPQQLSTSLSSVSLSSNTSSSASSTLNDGSRTIESPPSSVSRPASRSDSQSTVCSLQNQQTQITTDEDDDDWDFDTLKPQPSLEQILQHPPLNAEVPPPIPSPLPKKSSNDAFNTVDSFRGTGGSIAQPGSQSLVRIFSHASRKFKDPILDEISDLLRADPLTVGVENYLIRRIAKHATQHLGFKPREKPLPFDAVEQILVDKYLDEIREIHENDQH